ncbi:MAG: Thiol:disulfide interchange protein DsbE [Alphaproteobacteria bacterium MarineAlpha5_Bin9]|nr:MAG: Thiol:disulfide interchange protein DsbE [Alphaproteobacteria bacterium MarineAlpha5_Bin9]|tara:strand:- start:39508 stop:40044 length:537 start_codon:yes stop_codon:yes gene_type:complete
MAFLKKFVLFLPIIITIFLFGILVSYLLSDRDANKPPSALLNKNIPNFSTVNLFDENKKLFKKDIEDKVTLINFFASWCIPCKQEHPLLEDLQKKFPNLIIVGFNHKDSKKDAIKFLEENGNPYTFIGIDDGSIGLEFGVFGLPETFMTDKNGKIIFKHIGPLDKKTIKTNILPYLNL